MAALVFVAIFWIVPIWVAQRIGAPKNRAGWAWGLLLGWIGVVIVAVLANKDPQIAAKELALSATEREVKELEAELRLAELQAKKNALAASAE